VGARLIHVSTDYVFDGKTGNYAEDDKPNPINYYGKTKLAAENAVRISGSDHAIVRTIVLYGQGAQVKQNFALWVINSLKAGATIRCVDDQIGNPTYVGDLAVGILAIVERERSGVYHIGGSERISRYDFALRIARQFGLDERKIGRATSADLRQIAARPLNTSFVILKAEAELGLKPANVSQGLTLLQRELQEARKN
jgi:dTDP-4-dehydrorhamnose reductase